MQIPNPITQFVYQALSLLTPPVCPICQKPADWRGLPVICSKCRPNLQIKSICLKCGQFLSGIAPAQFNSDCLDCRSYFFKFTWARSVSSYQGAWKSAILQAKSRIDPLLVRQMARYLYRILQKEKSTIQQIAWVASVPARIGTQENLAIRLGKEISQMLNADFCKPLRFARKTPPQHSLTRDERWKNLKNALDITNTKPKNMAGHIILIDDVFTTGATLQACSTVIKKHYENPIVALTLARSPRYGQNDIV
jgi:competence protein ComFC